MKEYYLSELLELKYGKDHKTLGNGTIPCYGSGGVIRYVNNSLYEKESILIPRKGSLNNLFFINKPFWTVDTLFWSIINEKIVLPRYLFYKLKNLNLSSFNEGSAVPSLTTKTLNKISIKIHDLKLQEKIVSILSLLDEKIELNKKINQNLEEIAQALFKRWFIDFEFPNKEGKPYKSSGGKMIKSELGEIPEGWETSELGKIVQISSGKRPKIKFEKNNIKESLYPIVGANGIMGYTNDFLIEDNVILIGRVGTIGNIKIYTFKIWPSDNTLIITSSYLEYMFFILKLFDFTQINRGSTQPLITQTDIKNLKIVVSKKYLAKFCNIISNNFKLIEQNQKETEKLIELRDYLLPKLMNGEIDVSNLKIFEILNSDKFN